MRKRPAGLFGRATLLVEMRSMRPPRVPRPFQSVFDLALWLPDVSREMALLDSQAERNAARVHVWRVLVRSRRYWVWTAGIGGIAIIAILYGYLLTRQVCDLVGLRGGAAQIYVFMLYAAALGAALGYGRKLLLRRAIHRTLRKYLCERGLTVCMRCGYDLRGQREQRCPECGAPAPLTALPDA